MEKCLANWLEHSAIKQFRILQKGFIMANAFGSTTTRTLHSFDPEAIADASVEYFANKFVKFNIFTKDFSTDIASEGDMVTTRLVSSMTAKELTGSTAYAADDVTATPISVEISKPLGTIFAFTESEIVNTINNLAWLQDNFMEPAVEAVLKRVFAMALPKLVEQVLEVPATGTDVVKARGTKRNNVILNKGEMTMDNLLALRKKLSKRLVPMERRSLVLTPDYCLKLLQDDSVLNVNQSGSSETLREGITSRLGGFDIYELPYLDDDAIQTTAYPTGSGRSTSGATATNTFRNVTLDGNITNTSGAVNTSSVESADARPIGGLALHPSAMIMVARQIPDPTTQGVNAPVVSASRVEPTSGLPFTIRAWFDTTKATYNIALNTSVGFAVGQKLAYERIADELSGDHATVKATTQL